MKRIDLNNVANDVCLLLRPLARQRRIQLELDVTLAAAPVQGRDVQLEQALSNVIANAIDASPEGGRISISLSLETRKSETSGKRVNVVAVRVRDQGPGVPEAEVARLFEPFYTSKVPGEGTGLGLWLTDGIVRDHGGSIEVENGTDGGACFALVFPTIDVEGKVS